LREENDRVFASRMKIFTAIERVNVAAVFRDDFFRFFLLEENFRRMKNLSWEKISLQEISGVKLVSIRDR
jgi:hypothetical protein